MSTYTPSNRLILQATNENVNTWGDFLNNGGFTLLDSAMDGVTSLALTGDLTLTVANGASDQARRRTIVITSTGGANRIITIPSVEKWYNVINDGAQPVTLKTAAGSGAVVPAGVVAIVLCGGVDCRRLMQSDFGLVSTTSYSQNAGAYVDLPLSGGYKSYRIKFYGISVTSVASTCRMAMSLSNNGSVYSGVPLNVLQFASAGATYYGEIELPDVSCSTGRFTAGLCDLTTDLDLESDQINIGSGAGQTPTGAVSGAWRVAGTGGVKFVRFTCASAGGFTFDAGTFEVWGR